MKKTKPSPNTLLLSKVGLVLNAVYSVLDEMAKPQKPIKIEVGCSCCADTQKEILAIVKDIQKRLPETDSVTKEEIHATLGEPVAGLGQLGKE